MYRSEIDGLRAIAVGAVIAQHAGAPLSGGFLGVDIFFVISGFLITGILVRELENDTFSLAVFYERRARRILPSLIVVVFCSMPFAWILMSPDQLKAFAQSLVALFFFATNFLFWRQSGYFAPDAEEIAMLHTWSLAVEEQYYVLFPLMLMVFWRFGWRFVLFVLCVIAFISLIFAEVAAYRAPSFSFYMLPFRAWELLAGAIAAFLVARYGLPEKAGSGLWSRIGRLRNVLSLAGLGMITASLVFYDPSMPIPGFLMLVPVAGAVLVLLVATPGTIVHRVLSQRLMVGIGLISYSAYLWHQPLFAFARIAQFDPPPAWHMLLLTLLTFALAYLNWRFVEQPFRGRKKIALPSLVALTTSAGVFVLLIGLAGHFGNGFGSQRFQQWQVSAFESTKSSPKRGECHRTPPHALTGYSACRYFGDAPPTWAIFGDSHVVELAYALGEVLKERQQAMVHLSASRCPPALNFASTLPGCTAWNADSLQWLEKQKQINTVVLVWRHGAYLFGQNGHDYPKLPDKPDGIEHVGSADEKRTAYWSSVEQIVDRLKKAGKRVIFVESVPEIARSLQKHILFQDFKNGRTPTVSRAYYDQRNAFVETRLEALDVEILRVSEAVCDKKQCYGVIDGKAMYFDDNHLSLAGARRVVKLLVDQGRLGN